MDSQAASDAGSGRGKRRRSRGTSSSRSRKPHRQSATSATRATQVQLPAAWQVRRGTAGDHPAAHQLLVGVFQRPSAAEFQSQLDQPLYEPSDRLLIKDGRRLVSHLRMCGCELRFDTLDLPACVIADVATLREYRERGCATVLLNEARKLMVREGAELALLRTDDHRFYIDRGWVVCGRHAYSTANPRSILAYLEGTDPRRSQSPASILSGPSEPNYNIRQWRHVEQAALMRLYEENTRHLSGPLIRSESYWRWLVGRDSAQQIYVAIDGPVRLEFQEAPQAIVGYAVVKEGRMLELMYDPAHPRAGRQLLARACSEAIEGDCHHLRFDAPVDDPMHQVLVAAGGTAHHHEADQGMVFMAQVPKLRTLLERMGPLLYRRARQAGLPQPYELGLLIGEQRFRLKISRRDVQLVASKLGRSYVRCFPYVFTQLLLGHLDVHASVTQGRVVPSTRVAQEAVAALFPRVDLWHPPWDSVAAL